MEDWKQRAEDAERDAKNLRALLKLTEKELAREREIRVRAQMDESMMRAYNTIFGLQQAVNKMMPLPREK